MECYLIFNLIYNYCTNNKCNEIERKFLMVLEPFDDNIEDNNIDDDHCDYVIGKPNIYENKIVVSICNKPLGESEKIIEITIEAQKKIDMFRPDFVINNKYIIEIDGHDFHEKTKDQVKADKKRERYLQKKGYTVIRFSGSEVYNSIYLCWNDIFSIIFNDEWSKQNG